MAELTSTNNLVAYNKTLSGLPPRTSTLSSDYVQDPTYQLAHFANVTTHYGRPQPLVAAYLQCWNLVDGAIKAVFQKKQTAQDALPAASKQWDAAIAQAFANAKRS